jgi:hypothetical protein
MKYATAILGALILLALIGSASAQSPKEKAITACMIGQASDALLNIKKSNPDMDAERATDRASMIASKKCPGRISEAGGDYVYFSVRALARRIFEGVNHE